MAERWARSLYIQDPQRRIVYVRKLEPVAAAFLDILANHLKKQDALRTLNDSRVFEQLEEHLRSLRSQFNADKATFGTRSDYLHWLIERNMYIDSRGTQQTQRQIQVKLNEVYVSLRAAYEESPCTVDLHSEQYKELMARLERDREKLSVEGTENRLGEMQERLQKVEVRSTTSTVLDLAEAVQKHAGKVYQVKLIILDIDV